MNKKAKGTKGKGKSKKTKKVMHTLAEGEVTGHAHRLTKPVEVIEFNKQGYTEWVQDETADLTHEEHHTHTLPPGHYGSDICREKNPLSEAIERVRD